MTLRDELENVIFDYVEGIYNKELLASLIEMELDDFAVGFVEWICNHSLNIDRSNLKELLKMYKKEKNS